MSILYVSCGEPFEPVTYGVMTKDAITKLKTPIDDYTDYKWYCTVKLNMNDSDEDSLTGKVLNSSDDPERFNVLLDRVTVLALTQADTMALNKDLTGGEKNINGVPVIEEVFFDIWYSTDESKNSKPIQRTVAILKPVSENI